MGDSSLPDLLKYDKSSHRRIEGVTDDTQIQKQSTHSNNTVGPLRLLKDAGPIEYLYKLKNLTIEATFVIVYHILSPMNVGLLNEGTRLDKKKATESNVVTQTLLQNKILRVIKKNYVTKYLEMLAEIAELKDDRKKFYERFVKCMKLETAELLRFNTFKSGDEHFSFEEYVDRMKERQNDIYCITGQNIATVSSRKKGQEVLYVADPVNEYAVHQPKGINGMKGKPTTKEGLDHGDQPIRFSH